MNTQEQIKKTAKDFGVPMPDTCKALDWKEKTFFAWIFHEKLSQPYLCFFEKIYCQWLHVETQEVIASEENFDFTFFYAPQMHEIAPLLPLKFETNPIGNLERGRFYHWFSSYSSIGYTSFPVSTYLEKAQLEQFIVNHHYAQAYAELYLKLKEKNLLTTQ